MLEHKTIQWILRIMVVALIGYAVYLLMNEDDHRVIRPKQEYVAAPIDSAVPVLCINPQVVDTTPVDTFVVVDMPNVVAVVDSDSTKHYNLYRHQQATVTIDLEEHEEKVFFTWDDVVSYFHVVVDFCTELINKHK